MELSMDRRQKKSRTAIFRAFTELLCEYRLEQITVSRVIERADVGRATFYAHFETKDALTLAFCQDLFCHIFDSIRENCEDHVHLFRCESTDSVFIHLCKHLQNNDHQILRMLVCQGDNYFVYVFKEELKKLFRSCPEIMEDQRVGEISVDFWLEYLTNAFLGVISWWHSHGLALSAQQIMDRFMRASCI